MKRFLALALCLLLCAGCSPREAVTPEPSPSPSESAAPTTQEGPLWEMASRAKYLGFVTIQSVNYDGAEDTSVYVGTVSELVRGSNLKLREDGTILLSLSKGAAEVGETYFVGFNQAETASIIYHQATPESVIPELDLDRIRTVREHVKELYPSPTPYPSFTPPSYKPVEPPVFRTWSWGERGDNTKLYEDLPEDDDAYNAEITRRLEAWAEEYDVTYDFSQEDLDAATELVRAVIYEWATEPYVNAFEVYELGPSRVDTLYYWYWNFAASSGSYSDWTKEQMEQDLMIATAWYLCDYDGTRSPLFDGRQFVRFYLVRGEDGVWEIKDRSWFGGVLRYPTDATYEEYLEKMGKEN